MWGTHYRSPYFSWFINENMFTIDTKFDNNTAVYSLINQTRSKILSFNGFIHSLDVKRFHKVNSDRIDMQL